MPPVDWSMCADSAELPGWRRLTIDEADPMGEREHNGVLEWVASAQNELVSHEAHHDATCRRAVD
jgi:hypothetical protein